MDCFALDIENVKGEAMVPNVINIGVWWLPERDSKRTIFRVITEVIPYHYRWHQKRKVLIQGKKPNFIPKNVILSEKAFRHHLHVEAYENPIEKAREYERLMNEEGLNQT